MNSKSPSATSRTRLHNESLLPTEKFGVWSSEFGDVVTLVPGT